MRKSFDGNRSWLRAAAYIAALKQRFEIEQTSVRQLVLLLTYAVIRRIFVKSDRLLEPDEQRWRGPFEPTYGFT